MIGRELELSSEEIDLRKDNLEHELTGMIRVKSHKLFRYVADTQVDITIDR